MGCQVYLWWFIDAPLKLKGKSMAKANGYYFAELADGQQIVYWNDNHFLKLGSSKKYTSSDFKSVSDKPANLGGLERKMQSSDDWEADHCGYPRGDWSNGGFS